MDAMVHRFIKLGYFNIMGLLKLCYRYLCLRYMVEVKNLKCIQGDKALLKKVTKEQTREFTNVLDKE